MRSPESTGGYPAHAINPIGGGKDVGETSLTKNYSGASNLRRSSSGSRPFSSRRLRIWGALADLNRPGALPAPSSYVPLNCGRLPLPSSVGVADVLSSSQTFADAWCFNILCSELLRCLSLFGLCTNVIVLRAWYSALCSCFRLEPGGHLRLNLRISIGNSTPRALVYPDTDDKDAVGIIWERSLSVLPVVGLCVALLLALLRVVSIDSHHSTAPPQHSCLSKGSSRRDNLLSGQDTPASAAHT